MPVSKKRRRKQDAKEAPPAGSGGRGAWTLTAAGAAALFAGAIWWFASGDGKQVEVAVPPLAGAALKGEQVFAGNCARCHGKNAAGSKYGPPLVHKIYEPGHHGDASFYRAAAQGVRAHHWNFGDMPPVPGVPPQDIQAVVAYVRTLQAANGIR